MLLSMTTVAFAANNEWESDIDVVKVAVIGDKNYATLGDAFADQVETGAEYVSLSGDLTVAELALPPAAVLNLNGYTLTVDSIDATSGAQIIDITGGDALLIVKGECQFADDNKQLPVLDENAGGYRFFDVTVNSVGVTGKGAKSKYWFQVKFDKFEKVQNLLAEGDTADIKVYLNCDGQELVATAEDSFVASWVKAYKNNNGIYITAQLVGAEEIATIEATPAIFANGVAIKGGQL